MFGDRLYALILRHLHAEEPPREEALRARAKQLAVTTVAGTEVLYHHASRQPLQDVLTCIRHGTTLAGPASCCARTPSTISRPRTR